MSINHFRILKQKYEEKGKKQHISKKNPYLVLKMGQIGQHKSVFFFSIILILCVGTSIWLSHYISDAYFDEVITPILMVSTTTVALFSAVLMFKHSEGLRIRKVCSSPSAKQTHFFPAVSRVSPVFL